MTICGILKRIKDECTVIIALGTATAVIIGGISYIVDVKNVPIKSELNIIRCAQEQSSSRQERMFTNLSQEDSKLAMMFVVHESDPRAHERRK